jgi:hypothetical protein
MQNVLLIPNVSVVVVQIVLGSHANASPTHRLNTLYTRVFQEKYSCLKLFPASTQVHHRKEKGRVTSQGIASP